MSALQIVPVGEGVSIELLDELAARLARQFSFSCVVEPEPVGADAAYDERRDQYYSTKLLRGLADGFGHRRVLGVAASDLFVPILTFVFGEAQLGGTAALVSYCRLREEFYGLPANPPLLLDRLVKEAVHELGHTFGLRHCVDWRCVMATSHAPEVLDVKGSEFCARCAREVSKNKNGERC